MKIKLYNTYLVRDKDPVIDYLRNAKVGIKTSKLARDSGVSATTIANWFGGKTRKPQFATVVAVARAMGPAGTAALTSCITNGGRGGRKLSVIQGGKRRNG